MSKKQIKDHEREAPHSHLIQGMSPIIFMTISILDQMVLHWTNQLNSILPFEFRMIFFSVFIFLGFVFIILSHRTIFKEEGPSNVLITDGILKYTRNPMYFGILLIYIAFIWFSISLLAIGVFIGIFFVYNWMVKYEEKKLEEIFGEEFLDYKENVPRWLPRLSQKTELN